MSEENAQTRARDELYRGVIMEHARRPRNFGALAGATRRVEGHNPLCGDRVVLSLVVEGDVVRSIMFEGEGCALSLASASLLTEAVAGATVDHARRVHGAVTGMLADGSAPEVAGDLAALASVRAFPVRQKCVTLAWQTLAEALDHS